MKKLLIIDDEEGIIAEIKDFFVEEGYEVYAASTGKEGIELINKVHPDVVLIDIKLPDISGLDILKFTKQNFPATKVIVNTGYVDQQIIDEAERLGRDAFLSKPFDLTLLQSHVQALVK